MDLHQIFIVILVHITLVFSHNSDPNAEAKEAKLLTEKACKYFNVYIESDSNV